MDSKLGRCLTALCRYAPTADPQSCTSTQAGGAATNHIDQLIDAEQATLPVIGESRLEERLDKVLMRAEKAVEKGIDVDWKEFNRELDQALRSISRRCQGRASLLQPGGPVCLRSAPRQATYCRGAHRSRGESRRARTSWLR